MIILLGSIEFARCMVFVFQIAKEYEAGGASCLSVLTDSKYFKGGYDYLQAVRAAGTSCPLLCKEFIVQVCAVRLLRVLCEYMLM